MTNRSTTIRHRSSRPPPPISPALSPRLAVFVLRRYLRAVTAGPADRHIPPTPGPSGARPNSPGGP
ncbi:hypothetical protein [Streptomyces antarcticus]|uniref:hypothetical protein n=1 Tax=Streptomyces antarcticus TaxID=2996458 RepID=UPI00226E0F5D|nr:MULTISPECIES: hypothetical protein [unclassified Streptomyces]MCY0942334.1 hypothetical protein [Streptomyces sp. H34-AA3]MCZ4080669.1 hypothetical protein [Streptomyces sp. H34-S5]